MKRLVAICIVLAVLPALACSFSVGRDGEILYMQADPTVQASPDWHDTDVGACPTNRDITKVIGGNGWKE